MSLINNNNIKKRVNSQNKKPNLINNEIKYQDFTLIDDEGKNLGKVKRAFALGLAGEKELDLVLIKNDPEDPVCKIMDYGKYLYEQQRKQKDNKKKQTKVKVKEVKISPQIATNDLTWNAQHIIDWINDGNIVRVLVKTPGRLSTKQELIFNIYNELLKLVGNIVTVKTPLKMISSFFYEAVLEPKKGNKQ